MRPEFWSGRRVLVTGHTGFKGAWTSMVLRALGCRVFGCALQPSEASGLFTAAFVDRDLHHCVCDIRDFASFKSAIEEAQPSIIIHMAAQSLVRYSYEYPIGTYATNVMGTVNLLEASRQVRGIQAVIVVTSDKVYENTEDMSRHRESDRLGGRDPYSNSKACAELVTDAYRRSYFHRSDSTLIASARAGNVIGGGDWALDRLLPDAIRAFMKGEPLRIRSPHAVRPWQHVLDAVSGYLRLAENLAQEGYQFANAWNFGPGEDSEVTVEAIVNRVASLWGRGARWERDHDDHPHESAYLRLDCSKAANFLGWQPNIDLDEALRLTVEWYRSFHDGGDVRALAQAQIEKACDVRSN